MDTSPPRSRLLELPAELRTLIYTYALAPTGTLTLTTSKTNRFATIPRLASNLLATNHQIHSEASSIPYTDNRICIGVDAHDTCWPTISESRLPQRVLSRLQHLSIVLDCSGWLSAAYADVDWTPFTALTALETLRITAIWQMPQMPGAQGMRPQRWNELLREILERVPQGTEISFGTVEGSAERDIIQKIAESKPRAKSSSARIMEVDGEVLAAAMESNEDLERGRISGSVDDVFADYHEEFQPRSRRMLDWAI